MRRSLFVIVLLLAALEGCGVGVNPHDEAVRDARPRALRVSESLYDRSRVWSAQDMGHRAADLTGVQVVRVSGTSTQDREGTRVVVRLQGRAAGTGTKTVKVWRCFELTFSFGTDGDARPREMTCPATAPLSFAPWPRTPALPSEDTLQGRLPHVPPGGVVREADVRRAVSGLHLDPAIHTEFATHGDAVGVSVWVKPYLEETLDCVLVRVRPGEIVAFVPPSILRLGSEGGCDADNAIHPMPPPH